MNEFDYAAYLQEEQEYLNSNKDLFVFNNPHPQQLLVSDCVKRSITIATNSNYEDIALALNRFKKLTKTKKFNERKNWVKYILKEHKATKVVGFNNMKLGEFAKQNPNGSYVVSVRKHCVAVVNGKIHDTWNCSFKAVCQIFKIK
jgi:hypothetical protein